MEDNDDNNNKNPSKNFLGLGTPLNFFGTTGSHFLAIERTMQKILKHKEELEIDIQNIKSKKKSSPHDSDISMFEMRKSHLEVKIELLKEIQDACEKQLIKEADLRQKQDRKHLERQREIHRNGLDPSLVQEAALDKETWGRHRAEMQKKKDRQKKWEAERKKRRRLAVEAAEEVEDDDNNNNDNTYYDRNGNKKKKKTKRNSSSRSSNNNNNGKSKSRAVTTTSQTRAVRISRKTSSMLTDNNYTNSSSSETYKISTKYDDDGSDLNYQNRQKNQKRNFAALPGTDGAKAAAAIAVNNDNNNDNNNNEEEEEDQDVLIAGALRVPGDLYDKLFNYQQHCVGWMWNLHVQHVGGILGDEMGLGKTIQVIAFLAGLHHSNLFNSPTLILCPATVMVQWLQEIHKWYPPFRVWLLHPTSKTLNFNLSDEEMIDKAFEVGNIVITTYSTFRSRRRIFLNRPWGYVICDEGHKIRNPDADITICLKQIRTVHRLLLTGAPMQNNLKELWSLFDFVCPGRIGTLPLFEAQFIEPIRRGGYVNASRMHVQMAFRCATVLRDIMEPYLLRRLKEDVAKQLPKKIERVLFCKLTKIQRMYYSRYLESREVNEVLTGDRRSFKAITVLRKICNHVDLQDTHSDDITKEKIQYGQNWESSGKMIILDQVLTNWFKNGDKALIFSQTKQMLDIIEIYINQKGYNYLRMDGDTTIGKRSSLVDNFNDNENIFVFLLTTRVGGLGLNLIGANRVILFDPDWNPAVDVQARERVWRIGQKQNVTIYRLITSGTIEEKMYHRQIFKMFLANKILKDPRQKRFFKSQDLYELFTLAPEDASGAGTETGQIFGLGSEQLAIEDVSEDDDTSSSEEEADDDDGDDVFTTGVGGKRIKSILKKKKRGSSSSSSSGKNKKKNNGTGGDEDVMKALWNGSKLSSAFNHDVIDNNGAWNSKGAAVTTARAAVRFANTSRNALRQSRLDVMSDTRFAPTWTGRRGDRGGPTNGSSGSSSSSSSSSSSTQRFGNRQNRALLRAGNNRNPNNISSSTTTINGNSFSNGSHSIDATSRIIVNASQSSALTSNDLLSRFQSRQDDISMYEDELTDPGSLPNFIDPGRTRRGHHNNGGSNNNSSSGNGNMNMSNSSTSSRSTTRLVKTSVRKSIHRKKDGLGFMLGVKPSNEDKERRERMGELKIQLKKFLSEHVGRCSTELILARFSQYVDESEKKDFKKLLKNMAEVHDGFWHLKH